ncbi:MAG: cell wall-binding repeat-containing protein [Ornithinimicrobium sp.]
MSSFRRGRATLSGVVALAMIVPMALSASGQDAVVEEPVVVLDDFSDALPEGQPLEFAGDGYAFAALDTPTTQAPDPAGGQAITLGTNTASFAGLIRQFVDADGSWQPVDASASKGFSFWFLGTGEGTAMFVDVLDNRAPDSGDADTAGRWTVSFTDDVAGWRQLSWNWDEFANKFVGNGAPDDGFGLEEINGWGVGSLGTDGEERQVWIDNVAVFGERPLTLEFAPPITTVSEGDVAEVVIRLSRTTDRDVNVAWSTSDSTDRTASEDVVATPGRDYEATSGTVTIPAGEREATVSIPGVEDDTWEVDESYQVIITDTDGLPQGPSTRGVVSIMDDDERDVTLIENGSQPGLLRAGPETEVSVITVPAESPLARPGQQYTEDIVSAEGPGAVGREFEDGQDWSDSKGLSFWHYGSGSQEQGTVTVLDNGAADPGPDGWELTWSDEFDGAQGGLPDPENWSFETGGWGWGNQELQYYTDGPDAASLDGQGNLRITTSEVADPEAAGLPCWYGDCEYTSARLVTEGKQEFQYGRMEARLKAPPGTGIWPAFWSLGNDFRDVGWPTTGEIDFYEFVGREANEVFGTIHGPGYAGGDSFGDTITLDEPVPEQFHTITVDWQPELIEWFFDGVKFHEATPADVAPNDWPFDKPYTLLLNTALGGNFGGALGPDLVLPADYLIDYVRVYQAPDTAERWTADFPDGSGWRLITIPWSDFDRAPNQPAGAPEDGLDLSDVQGWSISLTGKSQFLLDELRLVDALEGPEVGRIGGKDRYETAALIAQRYPEDQDIETVYVANGSNFADALSASSPAANATVPATMEKFGGLPAPVLLTRAGKLPGPTKEALETLAPSQIVVLGGPGVVSEAVQTELEAYGDVERLGGKNRYATSALVALLSGTDVPVLYVASGAEQNFPDALSGGALAGSKNAPVLLTRPDRLDPVTAAALEELNPDEIVVLGGPGAVSQTVYDAAGADRRLAGANRYATAVKVSQEFEGNRASTYVASGQAWPDALAGSALSGYLGQPITLSETDDVPDVVMKELDRLSPGLVTLLGGEKALSTNVEDELNSSYPEWIDPE